jgi:hypothetical protein
MKKYIFTESQIKKILTHQINEQVPTQGKCIEGLFKNSFVEGSNTNITEKIKTGKFKVTHINGSVKLNDKDYNNSSVQKGIIITPETKINICIGSSMVMSGMGLRECAIVHNPNGLQFIPQVA